jgi:hypothetical protein
VLGPPKARHVDRPVRAALEALVPPGHFYRHLEATHDLAFVRELVRDRVVRRLLALAVVPPRRRLHQVGCRRGWHP